MHEQALPCEGTDVCPTPLSGGSFQLAADAPLPPAQGQLIYPDV